MTNTPQPGGIGSIGTATVARVGYGAMQLFEATSEEDAAAVLRRAVELGVNHVDTASFYGPGEVNRRIRQALAPYGSPTRTTSSSSARSVRGGPAKNLSPWPRRKSPPNCAPRSKTTYANSGSTASRW